ncbi:MAG: protein translocase subunit SecD [Burkholderiaceae bacterium]|nr:MAG: protein translocase subunit SecD [Burkholderiaceae bacterium]
MNRYPLWKYLLIVFALVFGLLYTAPNFLGDAPAVQVSSAKNTVKVDTTLLTRVEQTLQQEKIAYEQAQLDTGKNVSVRVRFADGDAQLKARDTLNKSLNGDAASGEGDYVVALNLLPKVPRWMQILHALPMNLGLDLRGGIHFLMQVDMAEAVNKRIESTLSSLRTDLRAEKIRYASLRREGASIVLEFTQDSELDHARLLLGDRYRELAATPAADNPLHLTLKLSPQAVKETQEFALEQNRVTLEKRVNQLGVSEPVVQRQGADRIVVQLPGVQDVAEAQRLLGRTATLEVRAVDETAAVSGPAPGSVEYTERLGDGSVGKIWLKGDVVIAGPHFEKAEATIDSNQQQAVAVRLNNEGGRIMGAYTRENVKKRMAIVLVEKGKGEVISAATIQGEFSNRFQITGRFSPQETHDLAILISSGAIAAPMEIIEIRAVGPSLGAENIRQGITSTLWGFTAIVIFMIAYYVMFGAFSAIALSMNMLLLLALLSLLPTTLTLPGIAALALALGMAIDSNVLINERIREELRNGATPQAAITAGYDRAWATILDSNVTTLVAGLALLIFGSGPVRGFAVVHCLGIATSMFSAVFVSRGLVNFWYGRQKKLTAVSIGRVWKADPTAIVKR